MSKERPSKGWRIHERNRKAEERRNQPIGTITPEDRINRFAIPSWGKIEGLIELKTHNNPDLYALSFKHRGVLREFYDARYAIATGGTRDLYEAFLDKYSENKRIMSEMPPLFALIIDSITPPKIRR